MGSLLARTNIQYQALSNFITQQQGPVIMVSNAVTGAQPQQCIHMDSVSTPTHILSKGKGTVLWKPQGAYSGRLECFVLLAAYKFLQAYLQQTQTNHSQLFTTPEHDNLRIIKLLINMQEDISIMPSTTTMNDYNLI